MGGEGRRALDDACAGSAAGRALAHASANPNHIWQDYRFTEADYISKGGILLQASRVPVCMLAEPQTAQEEWRERQSGAAGQTQGRSGVMPWELDPQWMYLPHLAQQRGETEGDQAGGGREEQGVAERLVLRGRGGHLLRVTGPMVWCARCACHAVARHGAGLKGVCGERKSDATQKRLQRLHAGRHPISGRPLV